MRIATFGTVFLLTIVGGAAAQKPPTASPNTDKELFNESLVSAKRAAPEFQSYVFAEIATAQMAHGYYDEALETARLVQENPDQLFTALVSARAKRGDVSGAKQMAQSASGQELKWRANEAIAIAQINSDDLIGAIETAHNLPPPFQGRVLQTVGITQATKGEIEAAIRTASGMEPSWADAVFYAVTVKLRRQGHNQQADEIAKRIVSQNMRRRAAEADSTDKPESGCGLAIQQAKQARYEEAYKTLQTKKCSCDYIAPVYGESRNIIGAEAALKKCSHLNPNDVSKAAADLAKWFAGIGNIDAALKFAEITHVPGAYERGEAYLSPALRDIARAWVRKDAVKTVLAWARSRPTRYERAMALLGIAEGIAPR